MSKKFSVVLRRGNLDVAYLKVACESGFEGHCKFSMWKKPAEGAMWHWDGDVDKPTISPSIACQACGWHKTITEGVAQ